MRDQAWERRCSALTSVLLFERAPYFPTTRLPSHQREPRSWPACDNVICCLSKQTRTWSAPIMFRKPAVEHRAAIPCRRLRLRLLRRRAAGAGSGAGGEPRHPAVVAGRVPVQRRRGNIPAGKHVHQDTAKRDSSPPAPLTVKTPAFDTFCQPRSARQAQGTRASNEGLQGLLCGKQHRSR